MWWHSFCPQDAQTAGAKSLGSAFGRWAHPPFWLIPQVAQRPITYLLSVIFLAPAVCPSCGQKECHHINRDLSSGEIAAIRGQIRFQPIPVKQDRAEAERVFSRKH